MKKNNLMWQSNLFVLLIGLVSCHAEWCDQNIYVNVGEYYTISSPGFLRGTNYVPSTKCTYNIRSDRPIKLTCNQFNIPYSPGCITDVLKIQNDITHLQQIRHCGTSGFTKVSRYNEFIITLESTVFSKGGYFQCKVEVHNPHYYDKCGRHNRNEKKVVDGVNAGRNEYPMMAAIIDTQINFLLCGATIINKFQLLTAAHCMYNRDKSKLKVLLGAHDLSAGETTTTKSRLVAQYIIHPNYLANRINRVDSNEYDIAIINVNQEILFTEAIGSACLPFSYSTTAFESQYVDLLGWGSTKFGEGWSNILQKISVPVITQRECRVNYRGISFREMCTHDRFSSRATCQFDSGGPALWYNSQTDKLLLVAIISYSHQCADGTPDVNTNVIPYLDWIVRNTPRGVWYE